MSTTANRPRFTAFVKAEGKEKATWIRVGAAFDVKNGKGLSIKLNALPIDGQLFLFEPKPSSPAADSSTSK